MTWAQVRFWESLEGGIGSGGPGGLGSLELEDIGVEIELILVDDRKLFWLLVIEKYNWRVVLFLQAKTYS